MAFQMITGPGPDGDTIRTMAAYYDDADAALVEQFSWHLKPEGRTFYPQANVPARLRDMLRLEQLLMHQVVMHGRGRGRIGHLDGNGMNNRRSNLRFMTQDMILAKRRPSGGTSPYKGVAWDREQNKWVAVFRRKRIGRFRDEQEAARAFDRAAREYWGDLAYQNFPDDQAAEESA